MSFPEWGQGQANPETPVNEALDILKFISVYGRDPDTTAGLTWGYLGGGWLGFTPAAGTLTLTNSATNYMVVARATGVASVSTSNTNWNNIDDYARVFLLTVAGGLVTAVADHRARTGGIFAPGEGSGGGGGSPPVVNQSGTSLTADDTNSGNYTRFTNAAAKTYTFDSAETYADGAEYHVRNVGAGDLTLTEAGTFTLNAPAGGSLVVPQGGTATIKIVGTGSDEADVIGVTVEAP